MAETLQDEKKTGRQARPRPSPLRLSVSLLIFTAIGIAYPILKSPPRVLSASVEDATMVAWTCAAGLSALALLLPTLLAPALPLFWMLMGMFTPFAYYSSYLEVSPSLAKLNHMLWLLLSVVNRDTLGARFAIPVHILVCQQWMVSARLWPRDDTDTQTTVVELLYIILGAVYAILSHRDAERQTSATAAAPQASQGQLQASSHKGKTQTQTGPFPVSGAEMQLVQRIMEQCGTWSFDVLDSQLSQAAGASPFLLVAFAMFKKFDLIKKFNLDQGTLRNLLTAIEGGYEPRNPYHNANHGMDVAHSLAWFLRHGSGTGAVQWADEEVLASVLGALVHDLAHPGVNNAFLIATSDPRAITYNDRSVLENYHCACFFRIVSRDENNIFKHLPAATQRKIRKIIVDLILITDLAQHFSFVGAWKDKLKAGSAWDLDDAKTRTQVLQMTIKCSDLGHAAKPRDQHIRWSNCITDEFFKQGDAELAHGLDVTPMMDRRTCNLAKSQLGFLNFLCFPMFEGYRNFLDQAFKSKGDLPFMRHLEANKAHWQAVLDQQATQDAPAATAAAATDAKAKTLAVPTKPDRPTVASPGKVATYTQTRRSTRKRKIAKAL